MLELGLVYPSQCSWMDFYSYNSLTVSQFDGENPQRLRQALLLVPGRLLHHSFVQTRHDPLCTAKAMTRLLGLTFQVRLVSFGG